MGCVLGGEGSLWNHLTFPSPPHPSWSSTKLVKAKLRELWIHHPPLMHMTGCPRSFDSEQVFSICEQLNRAPEMYLDEVQDWVALTMQMSISKTALSLLIRDAGYSFKMLHRAASERDEED
jgi:transposase